MTPEGFDRQSLGMLVCFSDIVIGLLKIRMK